MKVIFYTKEVCSLCDDAKALLMMLQHDYEFELIERDIYTNDEWLEKYQLLIPYVEVNGLTVDCEEMSLERLEWVLQQAQNRGRHAQWPSTEKKRFCIIFD